MKWVLISRVRELGRDKGGYQFPAPPKYSNPYLGRIAVDIDDIILHHRLVCQTLELEKVSRDLRL